MVPLAPRRLGARSVFLLGRKMKRRHERRLLQLRSSSPSPTVAVKTFLKKSESAKFGPDNAPSPMGDTVRNLVDNSVVKTGITADHEKTSCVPVLKSDRLQLALDAANLEFGNDAEGFAEHLGRQAEKSRPGSTAVQNASCDVYGVLKSDLNGHQAAGFAHSDSEARGFICNFALAQSYTAVIESRRFSSSLQSNGQIIVASHQDGRGNVAWSNGQALQHNGPDTGDPRPKRCV